MCISTYIISRPQSANPAVFLMLLVHFQAAQIVHWDVISLSRAKSIVTNALAKCTRDAGGTALVFAMRS